MFRHFLSYALAWRRTSSNSVTCNYCCRACEVTLSFTDTLIALTYLLTYLQPIGKGGIVYNNAPWHRDCFCCAHCQRVLGRERFTSVDDQPYCVDCYGQLFAKRCSTCTKPITGIDGLALIINYYYYYY